MQRGGRDRAKSHGHEEEGTPQRSSTTVSSMAILKSTFSNKGQWRKAEKLEVQVMETLKRVLGPEHLDTFASMGSLAITYDA